MSIAGYEKKVQIKTTSSTTYIDVIGQSASLTFQGEMLDDTDFTSTGFRSRIRGLMDYSISITAFWDATNTSIQTVRTALLNGANLDFRYLPNGTNGVQGQAIVENMNHSGDVGGLEMVDISLQSAGGGLSTL